MMQASDHLPNYADERRAGDRFGVRLEVKGTIASTGATFDALFRNLSVDGALFETNSPLMLGDSVSFNLPSIGLIDANVIWRCDHFYGCQLKTQISPAAISGARLVSPFADDEEQIGEQRPANSIGQKIRTYRLQRQLSLEDLANKLHVSKTTVWNWERQHSFPRTRNIEAIARIFDTTAEDLKGTRAATEDVESEMKYYSDASENMHSPQYLLTKKTSISERLPQLIASSKMHIAELAGTSVDKITISIVY